MNNVRQTNWPDRADHGFSVRSDDYSLQISRPDDERFWLRIEQADGDLIITDFFAGALNRSDQAAALQFGLDHAGFPVATDRIIFRDIHSGNPVSDAQTKADVSALAMLILPILKQEGLGIAGTRISQDRGKVSARFTLSDG